MEKATKNLTSIVSLDSGIGGEYRHTPKGVTPGESLETAGAIFKWYAVHPQDRHVPEEIARLARAYLAKNALEARGLGFVILHLCGNDFYFLLVSSWRNNNELWETVFYKDGDAMANFEPFPRDRAHKPTFCVWELAPVWHEKEAWERFLISSRDDAAAQTWLRDCYAGAT